MGHDASPQRAPRVVSVGDTAIVVHEMAGDATKPRLLISHATGFHARCYSPVALALGDRFHVFGMDHRGHGASRVPDGWVVDWRRFGHDTLAVAADLQADGAGLIGVGHSMGGASLLMAAHDRPDLFDRLVLFEPIANAPVNEPVDMREVPLVQGALRRRRTFPTRADALANYASKPPLSAMKPAALHDYVEYGFRDADDGSGDVELCCAPELEAQIFMGGRDNSVWELLPDITTPCTIVGGRVEERQPSASTEAIADRLPEGKYVLLDDQSHFGPFSHPDELAALV